MPWRAWSSATCAGYVDNPVDKVDNYLSPLPLALCGPVLGIFAKEPRPGRVKTRLTPPLRPSEAAALYRVVPA